MAVTATTAAAPAQQPTAYENLINSVGLAFGNAAGVLVARAAPQPSSMPAPASGSQSATIAPSVVTPTSGGPGMIIAIVAVIGLIVGAVLLFRKGG